MDERSFAALRMTRLRGVRYWSLGLGHWSLIPVPLRSPAVSDKLDLSNIKPGSTFEATFWVNPVADSRFRYRATHLDGKRAPKVVLCDDPRVRPGVPALVKVAQIKRPERDDRGAILVELVRHQEFKLEGVYVDPIVAKKLQVLLESGQNILLD